MDERPPAVEMRTGPRIAAAVVVLLAAGAAAWFAVARDRATHDPRLMVDPDSHLFSWKSDGLRYDYHPVSGVESLWDLSIPVTERRNLIRERRPQADGMRDAMLRELRKPDLDSLRATHQQTIDDLRRLGYF